MRYSRRAGFWLALGLGASLVGHAGYLQAKARVAQYLLERAWSETRRSGAPTKPWPWADTRPVARLVVPRLAVEQIVLAGDSGRTLAFGPAWNEASAAPGSHGTVIVSGHRDTHFSFLQTLRQDDIVTLDTGAGRSVFRVRGMEVVDATTTRIDAATGADALVLVTCYPFDAMVPGGPLRYVVRAERIN